MESKYLLSICILTFNRCSHLLRILDFLSREIKGLGDNSSKLEIIISDNCSSDDTPTIISDFITKYANIITIVYNRNENNLGLTGNLNKSAELSNGIYHWWWGDDDYYQEGIVNRVLALCAKNPSHIFINNSSFLKEPGDNLGYESALNGINISNDDAILQLLRKNPGFLMYISANVYKNNHIKEILKSNVKINLAFPLYCSLYCISKGNSIIESNIYIDDNIKDISWSNSTNQLYLYDMPYYLKKLRSLDYPQKTIDDINRTFLKQLKLRRLKFHLRQILRKVKSILRF